MKAVVYRTPKHVSVDEVPDPTIEHPRDAILRVQAGQAPVHRYVDELMEMVRTKRVRADDIITHPLPIGAAPHAYKVFDSKEESCVKVVLDPWA